MLLVFVALATYGLLGQVSLGAALSTVYATKLTPPQAALATLYGLAIAAELPIVVWFSAPCGVGERPARRLWSGGIVPALVCAWIAEVAWLFALLYLLPWLALVCAYLATVALVAGWHVATMLTNSVSLANALDGTSGSGERSAAQLPASDGDGVPAPINTHDSLSSVSSGAGGGGSEIWSSGGERVPWSASTLAAPLLPEQLQYVAELRSIRWRAWLLARLPLSLHMAVAMLRVVLCVQIVAVNQYVLEQQTFVYELCVVAMLVTFTLVVSSLSLWQWDALLPLVASVGLALVNLRPTACVGGAACDDNDTVVLTYTTLALAAWLALTVVVVGALHAWAALTESKKTARNY
eukprot:TRINITY_DN3545_c0_g1_i1.p2 TRINITY_DN3545_c0_g1~~TRINITY_DN3545_c0_g1_i1.p2  ORF type:complete len:352 (-),score=170.80 TRINITY_DN3545_c0_g1_i1:27-1082(-)